LSAIIKAESLSKSQRAISRVVYSKGMFSICNNVSEPRVSQIQTESRTTEPKAIWSPTVYESLFNEATDAIFLVDAQTLRTLDCNRRAVELYEAESKQILLDIEGHQLQRQCFTPEELSEISQAINQSGSWSREIEYVTLKGKAFWGQLTAKQFTVEGQLINVIWITDITARKTAEAQIRRSLQEKELLLKEVHHRVKNNLHIISNLLDLQSDQITDKRLLEVFTDSQNRIQAMALVHEQLYQAEDFGKVEFGDYIYRLVNNLMFSYGDRTHSVHPVVKAEPTLINIETAIPCGLLLNELVTNSFKHAFPDGEGGEVHIQLYRDANQLLNLKIWDNGIGMPPELEWQNSTSLGLKLVKILAKQLKAVISFDRLEAGTGTSVRIAFSELKHRPRF
jgi:PAS domain S-box-containing protein